MSLRKALNTIVVKTVGSRCNLNCDYCFYLNKELKYSNEKLMSDETLDEFISQMMEQSGNSFGIVWQGGEPSLAGAAFFEKAIFLIQKYGEGKNKIISNMLQTNGYYLSDELIKLLSQYSFLVGLSLDGPENIHNTYRKTRSGKDSWSEVIKSWEKLSRTGIACNILCCVTSLSASNPASIYNFYKNHQMSWLQYIPVMERNEKGEIMDFSVSPFQWGKFMCHIFDYWYQDYIQQNNAPNIRFIENAFQMHLGMESPECTYSENCGNYLVLEHNGDVFSCDYLVNHHTKLGNIHKSRLIELLNSKQQSDFGAIKTQINTECKNCKFLSYCHGGCPKYRNSANQKYEFCESWKRFLEYSHDRLSKLANDFRKNNPDFQRTLDLSGYF